MVFDIYVKEYVKANKISSYTFEAFSFETAEGDIMELNENEVFFLETIEIVNPISFHTNDEVYTNINSLFSVAICTGFIHVTEQTGDARFTGIKLIATGFEGKELIATTNKDGEIENLKIQ